MGDARCKTKGLRVNFQIMLRISAGSDRSEDMRFGVPGELRGGVGVIRCGPRFGCTSLNPLLSGSPPLKTAGVADFFRRAKLKA